MYFNVLLGTKHIDLVKAASEEAAISIIEKNFGPASNYSTKYNYTAVRT